MPTLAADQDELLDVDELMRRLVRAENRTKVAVRQLAAALDENARLRREEAAREAFRWDAADPGRAHYSMG